MWFQHSLRIRDRFGGGRPARGNRRERAMILVGLIVIVAVLMLLMVRRSRRKP
jgi:hypothetical protein